MPVVTEHSFGAPAWFELGTTDQAAAKAFYGDLFGWNISDSPMGPGQYYTTFKLGGRDVAAAYSLSPEMVSQGVPPHWHVYFSTPDVDKTTSAVTRLGGTVIRPPVDAMDYGRLSVCKDPGGAVFSLWQARTHNGVGVMDENNAVCWSELATWDARQAGDFYRGLFNWATRGSANMPTYLEFSVAGKPSGGLLAMDDNWKGMPSHWAIYVMVANADEAAARAKSLGGSLKFGPFDTPGVGRIALLADPQGAVFYVITLNSAVTA
ncbi:MAG: VOC family protein [Bryobacterales bacterium]|nr:VOC family protein [Bryobacterales bacterium]